MTRTDPPNLRPKVKQNQIADELRQQIVRGVLRPGRRLPLRDRLQKRYNVSVATLQGALSRLMDEGFIQSNGRRGTFVTQRPPHLYRYGVALPRPAAAGEVRSRFWQTLAQQAAHADQHPDQQVQIFYGVDGHPDSEATQALTFAMRHHLLAGVIFAKADVEEMSHASLLQDYDVPCVVIHSDPKPWGVPVIRLDMKAFLDRALDLLAQRGRRNIALITLTDFPPYDLDHFEPALAKRGLRTEPHWMQCVGWPEVHWARRLTQLLMHPEQRRRPDGLILLDDNLVDHAVAGLVAAGVQVPRDLEVVAHANFPITSVPALPVHELGFDVDEILSTGLRLIDQQRRGQQVPHATCIVPRLAGELATPSAAPLKPRHRNG